MFRITMAVIKCFEPVITGRMGVIMELESVINYLSDSTNEHSYGKLRAV